MVAVHQLSIGRYEPAATQALQDVADSGFVEIVRTGAGQRRPGRGADHRLHQRRVPRARRGLERVPHGGQRASSRARSAELNDEAATSQRLYFALAGVAIVVAVLVTWLVSRSITRPLRSLTRQAKEMAERRLPEAVIDILETPLGDDVDGADGRPGPR